MAIEEGHSVRVCGRCKSEVSKLAAAKVESARGRTHEEEDESE